jgi:hypothetical protein
LYRAWNTKASQALQTTWEIKVADSMHKEYIWINTADGEAVRMEDYEVFEPKFKTSIKTTVHKFTWQEPETLDTEAGCTAALYNPLSNSLSWKAINCSRRYENVQVVCTNSTTPSVQTYQYSSVFCPKFYVGFQHPHGHVICLMIFDIVNKSLVCSEFGGSLAAYDSELFSKYSGILNKWVECDSSGESRKMVKCFGRMQCSPGSLIVQLTTLNAPMFCAVQILSLNGLLVLCIFLSAGIKAVFLRSSVAMVTKTVWRAKMRLTASFAH